MKFHSLMAAALLLPAFDGAAAPLGSAAPAAVPQGAVATAAFPNEACDASHAFLYRNGELVLDLRVTAGAEILRTGLAYFFHDERGATANGLPAAPAGVISARERLADAPLPEPLSLGLLGAGLAVLGWTRRQGSWLDRVMSKPTSWNVFPWPALSWLD